MMKKGRWLILLGLLLGAMALPTVQAAEPWDTIKQVVTLEPLMRILGFSALNPLEGLVRMLILVVLFAVFFAGAEMLKLGKNISITIAAVFALISAIFIPGSVILAIGAGYGTLISVLLLGVPVVILAGAFFWLKDSPKSRLLVMILMVWVLYQMQGHIVRFGTGGPIPDVMQALRCVTGAAWVGLALSVLGWALRWGGTEYHPNAAGSLFNRFTQKTGLGAFTEKGQELRHARIEETRLLNDLAVEQKELEALKAAKEKVEAYNQIAVNEFLTAKKCNSNNHFKTFQIAFKNVDDAMKTVKDADHQWKRAERKEVAEMRRLVKEMISNQVSDGDRKPIEAQEQVILGKYIIVNQAVNKALRAFEDVSKFHETVDSGLFKGHYKNPANVNLVVDVSKDPKMLSALGKIGDRLKVVLAELSIAYAGEKNAVATTASLAQQIKDKWLVK